MVSFLKNFALGAVQQLNTNAATKQADAQKQADEIRQAKLKFSINDELQKNTAQRSQENEMAKLQEQDRLKRAEQDRELAQFNAMTGNTMPGSPAVQTPGQGITAPAIPDASGQTNLAPLLNTPTETMPNQPAPSIDDHSVDPSTASDDPVINSLTQQYQMLAAKGKFNEALDKRTELQKYRKTLDDKDPVKKGQNSAKELAAQAQTMRDQGVDEDVIQSKVYGIKAPKEIDPTLMRDLIKENKTLTNSYQQIQNYSNTFNANSGAFNVWTQLGAQIAAAGEGLNLPAFLTSKISDPATRQQVQQIITTKQASINALRDAIADKGTLSNQDRIRAESATAAFNTFTDPVAIKEAYRTLQDFVKDKLETNIEYMKDPTQAGAIKRSEEMLYGKQITPDKPKNQAKQPGQDTAQSITDPTPDQYNKMKPGTPYTYQGVQYIKGQ